MMGEVQKDINMLRRIFTKVSQIKLLRQTHLPRRRYFYAVARLILFCFCWMLLSTASLASSISQEIKEGNRLYNLEKYDEAIEKYNEAKAESPDSDIANYNLGAALYKKGSYREAVDSFTKALNTDNRELETKATYNIANTKYKLGALNAATDLNSAINLYRESLDYYKRSIELDENNKDAKYNRELVERELKVLLDKLKNRKKEQNRDQKDRKQDKEKGQDKQESQAKSDDNKKEEKQQPESGEKSADKDGKEEKSAEKDAGQEQVDKPYKETEKMSPEEARMLLEAYGEDEASESMKKRKRGYYPGVLKDW